NIFGPRQDPNGAYAAVIPKWINALIHQKQAVLYGTGETTRDFCFVGDVVQANILSALSKNTESYGKVYNIGLGQSTSLIDLWEILKACVVEFNNKLPVLEIEKQ